MDSVFVLQHMHEFGDGHEDLKVIGIYKTRWDAESVLQWIKDQPGFRLSIEGFSIEEWQLNETAWRDGYTTAMPDGTFED